MGAVIRISTADRMVTVCIAFIRTFQPWSEMSAHKFVRAWRHAVVLETVVNSVRKSPGDQAMEAEDLPVDSRVKHQRIDLREEAVEKVHP
jgi:predicted Holliday junction resolvase-like endonuclease